MFVPAILTLGLLFLFVPFIINTVMLWLTDKLVRSFEIETVGGLLGSAAVITVANGISTWCCVRTAWASTGGASQTRWI